MSKPEGGRILDDPLSLLGKSTQRAHPFTPNNLETAMTRRLLPPVVFLALLAPLRSAVPRLSPKSIIGATCETESRLAGRRGKIGFGHPA